MKLLKKIRKSFYKKIKKKIEKSIYMIIENRKMF